MRLIITLIIALLLSPFSTSGKCPINFLEVHGQAVGTLSPSMRVSVELGFKDDVRHPQTQITDMKGGSFAQSVEFSTLSRRGHFGGLFGEWGEKCSRVPDGVVVALVDQDGQKIDKVALRVRIDFVVDSNAGFVLHMPITLHAKP